jgi:hypothetical protein
MDLLDVVRQQIERGELQKAKRVLVAFVRQRPGSVPAWTLLAGLLADPTQQAACYRRILDLDPANTQAAAAIQRLTETSEPPEVSGHGKASEHAIRATDTCSTKLTPPNENKRTRPLNKDHVPDETHVTQPMQKMSVDDQTTLRIEQMDSQARSSSGILKWFQARSRVTVRNDDATSQQDESSLLLSPEELIEAAGGALPPEERRKCPECATTLPKQASRCGWCGIELSEP